ncbi:hypothetical protein LIA77_07353 [Sarocladium implicatum]|nr:hypothetical protein LIA77_07353 [Sarocladium implicatum]
MIVAVFRKPQVTRQLYGRNLLGIGCLLIKGQLKRKAPEILVTATKVAAYNLPSCRRSIHSTDLKLVDYGPHLDCLPTSEPPKTVVHMSSVGPLKSISNFKINRLVRVVSSFVDCLNLSQGACEASVRITRHTLGAPYIRLETSSTAQLYRRACSGSLKETRALGRLLQAHVLTNLERVV